MTALLDSRTGVLTAVGRHPVLPGMPRGWTGWEASVADAGAWSPGGTVRVDPSGCGASLGDDPRARAAAIGEAVERYCGNVPLRGGSRTAWAQLRVDALDPEAFALHSSAQHAQHGFPFVPFTRQTPVRWLVGQDLVHGGEVLVPAALAVLDARDPEESPLTSVSYSGIATGPNRQRAEQAALEELLERDATTIWWASGAACSELVGPEVAELRARLDDQERRRVRFLLIPSPHDVPVVGVLVEDERRGVVAFGSACRASVRAAAEKALVEAFGLWSMTVQLDDPHSPVWRARAQLPAHTFVPYRADRRYRDSFRPDWHDLVDLPAVAQLYLDPRMQGAPLARLRPRDTRAAGSVPDIELPRRAYLDRLAADGLRVASVDLTTSDVAQAGLCVVRVVVPGLLGNAPAAFPYRGGGRLRSVPVALGWVQGPLAEAELVTTPLPLA